MSDALRRTKNNQVCFYLHALNLTAFPYTNSPLLSSFREPIGLDDVDTDIPVRAGAVISPAASAAFIHKRPPAPHRSSKDAERAAKKARLETTKKTSSSSTASKTSKSTADRGVTGGKGTQSVDPIAPSPPHRSDSVSAPMMITLPIAVSAPPVMTTTPPIVMTAPPTMTTTPPVTRTTST